MCSYPHLDVPTVPEVPADTCGSQMPLVAFDTEVRIQLVQSIGLTGLTLILTCRGTL